MRRVRASLLDDVRGDEPCLGRSGGRSWSGPTLALLGGLLLAVCAWFLLRSGEPDNEALDTSWASEPGIPARDVPQAEAAFAATESQHRAPATEFGIPAPPAPGRGGIAGPETLVYGLLLDASGTPIRGASSAGLEFVDQSGHRRFADARKEGAYAIHGLGFGSYWVTASAEGYRSLEGTVELRPDWALLREDFTLQKAVELRVRVMTPEGGNLFDVLRETRAPMGARVLVPVATREPPGKRLDEAAGSPGGTFGVGRFQSHGPRAERLLPGCMGILLLDCDLPVYVSLVHYQTVLQTKRIGSGQDEVTFILALHDLIADLAAVRVEVVDAETRLPIEGARVTLCGGTYSDQGTATNPQGIATIDRREPGRFHLQVSARGYERIRKPIDALPGGVTALGTVALAKEVTVEGRVLDLEGYPLAASFSLGVLDPADHLVHWFRPEGFHSSGDGAFEIRGLGHREYLIRTSNHDAVNRGEWQGTSWVSGNLLIDTRAGSIAGLEIRLRPAARLVLNLAGAADGMWFRIVDERGIELVTGRLHGAEPRAFELPAGDYCVLLLDPRGTAHSQCSTTLGSETVRLDLARFSTAKPVRQ